MIDAKNDYVITRKVAPTKAQATASFSVNAVQQDEVVAIGAGVENVKVGDIIVFDDRQSVPFEHEGTRLVGTLERNVIARVGGNE